MKDTLARIATRLYVVGALASLVSCSAGFNSSPYYDVGNAPVQKGVSYKLPRTVVAYSVSYTLYKLTQSAATPAVYIAWVDAGDDGKTAPLTLSPKIVGDETAVFVIRTPDLAAFSVLTKESKFSLTKDGVLLGANAIFEDKTTEIAESVVSAGLKLGKLATNPALGFFSGRSVDGQAAPVYPKIEKIATVVTTGQIDYASQAIGSGAWSYPVPDRLVRQQLLKLSFGAPVTLPQVNISFHPEKAHLRPMGDSAKAIAESEAVTVSGHTKLTTASAAKLLKNTRAAIKPTKFKGLWVRQPVNVPVTVEADNDVLLSTHVQIADIGPTTLVPVKSRIATDRSTTLTMHADTGSINEHAFTSTSQGQKLAASLDTIVGKLEAELPAIIENSQKKAAASAPSGSSASSPAAVKTLLEAEGRHADTIAQDIVGLERDLSRLDRNNTLVARREAKISSDIDDEEEKLPKLKKAVNDAANALAKEESLKLLKLSEERILDLQSQEKAILDEKYEIDAEKKRLEKQLLRQKRLLQEGMLNILSQEL